MVLLLVARCCAVCEFRLRFATHEEELLDEDFNLGGG